MRRIALLASTALISACALAEPPVATGPAPICPVLESRNWHAWIDRMPGPGSTPTLNISGEVDLPTPRYSVALIAGPADRAMPPGLRFRLEAKSPGGTVPQVITPMEVRYQAPTPYSKIREIIISCGEKSLTSIPDVSFTE